VVLVVELEQLQQLQQVLRLLGSVALAQALAG
jgi:hypothetical protein